MMLLFFVALAPLLSFRWRRLAALCGGIIAEAFSPIPFGALLGLFLLTAFLIELSEQRLITRETFGWAVVALGATGIVAFGEAAFVIAFDRAPLLLALALLGSKLVIGVLIIGFLWMPVKLHLAHDKRR